jgi:hypothetical protein
MSTLEVDLEGVELESEDDLLADIEAEENARADTLVTQVDLPPQYNETFINTLVDKIYLFVEEFAGVKMYPYQEEISKRIIRSIVTNDGDEITALISRQAGKTEALANTLAGLMVLLPKLAKVFPDLLGAECGKERTDYSNGFWVGTFAPVESQAETLFSRIVDRLTSDHAVEIMLDPDIDESVGKGNAGGKLIRLKKSGSFCRMQTANPKAKIESKSYHLVVIDEAQEADEYTVNKSIMPMLAHYNGTSVLIGTPSTTKGRFYKSIMMNKRMANRSGARRNHFEYNWKVVAKYNPNYKKFVQKEMARIGEDSDEFQMSYNIKWLLERGMFVTESKMEELGDKSMEIVKAHTKTPVVVGIDPARNHDSTVVTVVWVDWSHPDEFGYFDHRILNWLEITGDRWEEQYGQIVDFLASYNVLAIAVDSNGMGGPVAERLAVLMPRAEVIPLQSDRASQSQRWKHLTELIGRRMVSWPSHAKTRRLRVWRRFFQQMIDLHKRYDGQYLLAEAPDEAGAHDDFPDSLANACFITKDLTMPTVEVSNAPMEFYSRRR